MIAKNCTNADLQDALKAINTRYADNIRFKTLAPKGKGHTFTLTVIDSHKPGSRIGQSGKRISAACWHVHGHFFDALFEIAPTAKIHSSGSLANPLAARWITKDAGNWQDWNYGSSFRPAMMSELCEC